MNHQMDHDSKKKNMQYRNLLIMSALSFVSMYVLMYSMVNTFGNVYNHLNQVYMAGLMTAPMVVFELVVMGAMYPDKRRNMMIIAAAVVIGIALFAFIRQQTAIGDTQFLRSMIPHHSGAILMCEEATIGDAELQDLCTSIIENQQEEIDQMEQILDRLGE